MTLFSKDKIKWVAIISFLLLIFVPGKMPLPLIKNITIALFGGLSLFSQFVSLKYTETKGQTRETLILMTLTAILVAAFFFI